MIIDLTEMRPGEFGKIKELKGGDFFEKRLKQIGVRPGKRLKKVSSHFWHGPHTVQIDNIKIAVGYGLAKKVFVEVDR